SDYLVVYKNEEDSLFLRFIGSEKGWKVNPVSQCPIEMMIADLDFGKLELVENEGKILSDYKWVSNGGERFAPKVGLREITVSELSKIIDSDAFSEEVLTQLYASPVPDISVYFKAREKGIRRFLGDPKCGVVVYNQGNDAFSSSSILCDLFEFDSGEFRLHCKDFGDFETEIGHVIREYGYQFDR
ncbi:MAG: hypothetical protein AAF226_02490, partial [Verrucomicrobiota bacterium]